MAVINTFKGTRDISGDNMRFRLSVLEEIRKVFVLYGFEPLETPVLERLDTLLGKYGDEAENLLFRLSPPHEDGGLRYDHTVPLARFAAANWNELPKPYKRYAIGPVFRAENPQSGRYRQFYQCDFDTLGSSSLAVDAEIVAINAAVLTRLGFTDEFSVNVNDRKLLNAMAHEMGFVTKEQALGLLRAWDKLDKNTPEEVFEYLVKEMAGLGIDKAELSKTYTPITKELLVVKSSSSKDVLNTLRSLFKKKETITEIDNLENLASQIESLGVAINHYQLNPLLARGLGYYTGPIFETIVTKGGVGSITGGGRFDQLIEQMGGPAVVASGSSFGLDRLLVVMEELGLRPENSQTTQVFVTLFDENDASLVAKSFAVAASLRLANIPTEVYSGDEARLGSQFKLADRKSIPYVIIIGPEEAAKDSVKIKELTSGEESEVQYTKVVEFIQNAS